MEQYIIDRIKAVAKIEEVVGDFLPLKKHGVNYICRCPFHPDKTPSFSVSPSRNICKCFSCSDGKTRDSIEFVKDYCGLSYIDSLKYIANKYGIDTNENNPFEKQWHMIKRLIPEPQKPAIYLPMSRVEETLEDLARESRMSNLARFLSQYFSREEMIEAFALYKIGIDYRGDTLFWQIDRNGNARTAHIMPYDPINGHRLKKGDVRLGNRKESTWIQSRDFWQLSEEERQTKQSPDDFEQCLFGEHLLSMKGQDSNGMYWESKLVCIVESEKTALIMSMIDSSKLWLACCGLNSFGQQKKEALKGRFVCLFADANGTGLWQKEVEKLEAMQILLAPAQLVTMPLIAGCEKWDIADFELKERNVNYK